MLAAELSDTNWGSVIEGTATLGVSFIGVLAIGKFIMFFQERMVTTAVARNMVLEERVTHLEERLEAERNKHFATQHEMNTFKIESARQIGALQAQVDMLTLQLNRPHRETDIERKMDAKLDDIVDDLAESHRRAEAHRTTDPGTAADAFAVEDDDPTDTDNPQGDTP
ncbi:MAG: hypothetical protein LC687_01650 [Actinobacteria bacterium]|nr:hypothetical protein [Actinomycetota bacterium]